MAQSQAMAQREPGGACRELWCLAWARALQAEHSAGCQNSQSSVQALREHHGRIHPSPQHYQGLGIARQFRVAHGLGWKFEAAALSA